MEEAVDLAGIAKVLNVSVATVRRKAELGEIPGFKIGNRWRFIPSTVIERLSEPAEDSWARPARSRSARRAA